MGLIDTGEKIALMDASVITEDAIPNEIKNF